MTRLQWAEWGNGLPEIRLDPNEEPKTREMYEAMRKSGRDIIFSLRTARVHECAGAHEIMRIAGVRPATSKSQLEFDEQQGIWRGQVAAVLAARGHWNDPDMLEAGTKKKASLALLPTRNTRTSPPGASSPRPCCWATTWAD